MKPLKALTFVFGLAVALPVSAQMQPAPAPVGQGQLIEVTAKVEDIDLAKRLITVKGPQGRVVTSKVDPKVENLDKVKVGDEVEIKYYRAALQQAEKLDPSAKRGGTVTESAAVTGTVEDMPAGIAGREVRETVEILDVDPYKKAIAFRGMDGKYREISVDAPHLEHWLDDLKKGDKVRVAYREALAIMVEPK
jgi:pyrimidine operon attenuation protein/uracil phosphoribosyltransferase